MNYLNIYNNIIKKAKSENRSKSGKIYYENHHILPKCIGGTNEKSNLVLLTFKEHFVCHKLLYEIYKNDKDSYKLMYALHRMYLKGNCGNIIKSGKFYEQVRSEFCNRQSLNAKNRKGFKHTQETKNKISKAHKNKKISKDHLNAIKKYNLENRELKRNIAIENHVKGLYSNNSHIMKEKWSDEEFRRNISNKIEEYHRNNSYSKNIISNTIKKFRKENPDFKPNSKKVYLGELKFESIKEAAIHANMNYNTFVWNLKNNKNFKYCLEAFKL